MKDNYNKSVTLICNVCGNSGQFESNEDDNSIKCISCGKVYFGGYDELVEYNQAAINEELNKTEEELFNDLKNDINDMLNKALKGNKYIKIK